MNDATLTMKVIKLQNELSIITNAIEFWRDEAAEEDPNAVDMLDELQTELADTQEELKGSLEHYQFVQKIGKKPLPVERIEFISEKAREITMDSEVVVSFDEWDMPVSVFSMRELPRSELNQLAQFVALEERKHS